MRPTSEIVLPRTEILAAPLQSILRSFESFDLSYVLKSQWKSLNDKMETPYVEGAAHYVTFWKFRT